VGLVNDMLVAVEVVPEVNAVENSAQNCHGLLLTRHAFPDSLVGNGEGGGVPAVCRVYMNWGAAT
jgi:hypothetical protein